jgi:hypothetical protein
MMIRIFRMTCLAIFMMCFVSGFSQEVSKSNQATYLNRNSVQISGGFLLVVASASGFYERIIGRNNLAYFARAGVGTLNVWGSKGKFFMTEGGIITHATGKHHLDAAAGINFLFGDDFDGVVMPSMSVGYRNQKPGGHFVFRTGLGYFQGIYVGLGYSF